MRACWRWRARWSGCWSEGVGSDSVITYPKTFSQKTGRSIVPGRGCGGICLPTPPKVMSIVAALLVASACASTPNPPEVMVGTPYKIARARLIADGNHPLAVQLRAHGECLGRDDLCSAYPETESCAVDDDAPCRFRWKTKAGRTFAVFTEGELFDVKVSRVGWEN